MKRNTRFKSAPCKTNLSHHWRWGARLDVDRVKTDHQESVEIQTPHEVKHRELIVRRKYYSDANYCWKCCIWIPKSWETCKFCGMRPRTKPRAKRRRALEGAKRAKSGGIS